MRSFAAVIAVLVVAAMQYVAPAAHAEDAEAAEVAEWEVFAGAGTDGYSGDGGPATNAQLKTPTDVAVAPDGTVYICDAGNSVVRAVSTDGTISTVAGTGTFAKPGAEVPDEAAGVEVDLGVPQSLAVGGDGTLYIGDSGLYRVFALSPQGRLSVAVGRGVRGFGGDGGPAEAATIGHPTAMAVGPGGDLYIADSVNHRNYRVRAVSPDGIITTVAGDGTEGIAAGSPATGLPLPIVTSLTVDGGGDVWIAGHLKVLRLRSGKLGVVVHPGDYLDGRWGVSEAPGSPPDQVMIGIVAVAADGDEIYMYDQNVGILRLNPQRTWMAVAKPRPLLGGTIVAGPGAVYLADMQDRRVYVVHPPPPAPHAATPDGTSTWWRWLVPVGVVAALVGGWWIVRRARRSRTSPSRPSQLT